MTPAELSDAFRKQAEWCAKIGSPLYGALMERIACDVNAGGVCWTALASEQGDPNRLALPLRFAAALHRQALDGRLPALAKCYPTTGGDGGEQRAWEAFHAAVKEQVHPPLPAFVQTNEVRRSCALLPGFLEVARRTGLPLELLEVGASAGLNLRWDQYRYEGEGNSWGPAESPVVFQQAVKGALPWRQAVTIAGRFGCDLYPIDLAAPNARLDLLSFVWPDQLERFEQLSRAIDLAATVPVVLERASANEWVERRLAAERPGVARVVYHSIVTAYWPQAEGEGFRAMLERAGDRATAGSPLAWISMEPGEEQADVHLQLWPGGERWRIAKASFHGRDVELL